MAVAEVAPRSVTVDYAPRPAFAGFHSRPNRWAVIVAHRRAGKTVACVMELVTRALATSKTAARYAYIAPYREQAKQVAWDYLKRYAGPVAEKFSESELSVELKNGSKIRIYGADNPDALRGIYLDGVVMDEFADMRPSVWGEIIRPLLTDRRGWAVFIGTPKGRNAFYDLYTKALADKEWFSLTLKASETGLIAADELADARKDMTDNQYEQEFECSFDAAILGAIYAKDVAVARTSERITSVTWEPSKLVYTAWDIGQRDSTAIWFYQWYKQELRVIDFYEASGEKLPHYVQVLKAKPYAYDTCWLPHDAEHDHVEAEKTFAGGLRANGLRAELVPKLPLEQGINQARLAISRAYFDAVKCSAGLEALSCYRWDYNERLGEQKRQPVHDWSSHAADAWRYLAVSLKAESVGKPKPIQYDSRGIV